MSSINTEHNPATAALCAQTCVLKGVSVNLLCAPLLAQLCCISLEALIHLPAAKRRISLRPGANSTGRVHQCHWSAVGFFLPSLSVWPSLPDRDSLRADGAFRSPVPRLAMSELRALREVATSGTFPRARQKWFERTDRVEKGDTSLSLQLEKTLLIVSGCLRDEVNAHSILPQLFPLYKS